MVDRTVFNSLKWQDLILKAKESQHMFCCLFSSFPQEWQDLILVKVRPSTYSWDLLFLLTGTSISLAFLCSSTSKHPAKDGYFSYQHLCVPGEERVSGARDVVVNFYALIVPKRAKKYELHKFPSLLTASSSATTRQVQDKIYTNYYFPLCDSSVAALRTTTVNFKNKYPSVCPPWTWTPLPFCSLRCCSSETPAQKGQTDTSKSVVLSVFRCLGSWRTTMHFLVLKWKCLCLCVSGLVQQVTIATPTGCCSGQLHTEAQKTNYWTSKLWTSSSYRSTMLYRPGFGILQKEKWSSEWLLAQPPLFIHVCPPLGTVNTACRTTNI